jgi:hypothetical protein
LDMGGSRRGDGEGEHDGGLGALLRKARADVLWPYAGSQAHVEKKKAAEPVANPLGLQSFERPGLKTRRFLYWMTSARAGFDFDPRGALLTTDVATPFQKLS